MTSHRNQMIIKNELYTLQAPKRLCGKIRKAFFIELMTENVNHFTYGIENNFQNALLSGIRF